MVGESIRPCGGPYQHSPAATFPSHGLTVTNSLHSAAANTKPNAHRLELIIQAVTPTRALNSSSDFKVKSNKHQVGSSFKCQIIALKYQTLALITRHLITLKGDSSYKFTLIFNVSL